jgi:D-alanyl-D-alanine carboxypeptidase
VAFVSKPSSPTVLAAIAAATLATTTLTGTRASAEAMLLIEADSGRVLHAENATLPWYPASITKLMTAYVTLHAVKSGKLKLDSLLTVSEQAAAQAPSKIGFKPGTQVTVDNALKMLMVKSANDVAVVLAEGVGGSVEKFSDEMNGHAQRLGMTQSSFVNPNGLPADGQISSARDLAILARAAYKDFPEYEFYWSIPAIKLGKKLMRNHNSLIGRYPGADGLKTGFICASGFNLVASAKRNGKRLIAVVLGSQSSAVRGAKTAALLERGFNRNSLSWLTPSLGSVHSLTPIAVDPPDMREEMCGKHRRRPAAEEADEEPTTTASSGQADPNSPQAFMLSSLPPVNGMKASQLLGPVPVIHNPVVVYAGPAKGSVVDSQVARAKTNAKPESKTAAKNTKGKPSQVAAAPATATTTQGAAQPAAQPAAAGQIAAAPSGQFGPPPGQFTRSNTNRAMPAAGDGQPNPWLSFAPAARADTAAPLTAAPAPASGRQAMPMPRPRPKAPKQ